MKWPLSWYIKEQCEAPDAYWAAQVASLGELAEKVTYWTRGRLAGPVWLRRLLGDTREPLLSERITR